MRALTETIVAALRDGREDLALDGLDQLLRLYAVSVRFHADQATAALRDLRGVLDDAPDAAAAPGA